MPTTLGEQRGAVPAPADFGAARRAAPRSGPRRWNRREPSSGRRPPGRRRWRAAGVAWPSVPRSDLKWRTRPRRQSGARAKRSSSFGWGGHGTPGAACRREARAGTRSARRGARPGWPPRGCAVPASGRNRERVPRGIFANENLADDYAHQLALERSPVPESPSPRSWSARCTLCGPRREPEHRVAGARIGPARRAGRRPKPTLAGHNALERR